MQLRDVIPLTEPAATMKSSAVAKTVDTGKRI